MGQFERMFVKKVIQNQSEKCLPKKLAGFDESNSGTKNLNNKVMFGCLCSLWNV